MAMRRPRTSNRLIAKSNQNGVAEREEDGAERGGKPRKRKLSDMLGPAWSKDDLELFYLSYRKYGKDWKKVSGSMQKRTTEMVEALYGMNRAYLSLPEGAASAEGLIAMMTDHYNILDESEDGSSEEFGTSDRSHQMFSRLRTRAATGSHTNSGPSGYGGPSPAKKPRSAAAGRPWMVGKRTPRYPIANTVEQKGKNKVETNKMPQEETSAEDHELSKEAEGVALTLITTLHQAPSSLVPKYTPTRRNSRTTFQNGHAKETIVKVEFGGSGPKHTASTSGEVGLEGSQDSKEKAAKASSSATVDETEPLNGARRQTSDGKSRWRKPPAKRPKLHKPDVKNDEANEQCSQTGAQEDTRDEDDEKITSGQKKKRHSLQRTKRRSRQLFSGEKSSALDALATLADLSLNGLLPSPTHADSDEKEEEKPQRSESGPQVVKISGEKNGKEAEKREGHKKIHEDDNAKEQTDKEEPRIASGSRQQSTSPPESRKRKRKMTTEKLPLQGKSGAEDQVQNKAEPQVQPAKVETPVVLKPRRKPKRITTGKTLAKQGVRVNKAGEVSGLDTEVSVPGGAQSVEEGTLPLKLRSKKKGVAEKGPVNGFGDVSTSGLPVEIVKDSPNCPHTAAELGPFNAKARLIHCLSPKVRRWCMYEWFYSAIDLPWFAHNEFVEYLHHAGLGHVPRLTRVEWGVVRSSLGKPRRLSKSFLQEEREKLNTYRENVRTHYHELRTGVREGLPSDLARPLTVGQRVIARHPKTRQIHDGNILTVDRSRCRVQFDRPELGVEFVMDIDAMPIHPLENMPEIMRRKRIVLDAIDRTPGDLKVEVKSRVVSAGGAARAALNERLERPGSIPGVAVFSQIFLNNLTRIAQGNSVESVRLAKTVTSEAVAATQQALISQAFTPGQSQAREIDIRTLVELGGALNKKETLVVELRRMSDDSASLKGSDRFERQCSAMVLKLKEVNEQVFEALKQLRHRSKLQDSALSLWHRSSSLALVGAPSLADSGLPGSMEPGLGISDISASSKKHARAMVSVAVRTISALKEGEDPLVKISDAIDLVAKGSPSTLGRVASSNSSSCTQGSAPVTAVASTSASPQLLATVDTNGDLDKCAEGESDARTNRSLVEDSAISTTEEAAATRCITGHPSHGETKEALILSELMASCVATLLMVQTLTDRQYSAPDVAVTLDNALESLRPQAAQNHCIFRDIEQQLGYIKTQIVAQIPIQSSVPFPVENPISQSINRTS